MAYSLHSGHPRRYNGITNEKNTHLLMMEPSITAILRLFAAELGYSSDAAHSGKSALEKVGSDRYWAVCCDLQIPNLNGMEIYDNLKEVNTDLSGKFMLLTGSMLDS